MPGKSIVRIAGDNAVCVGIRSIDGMRISKEKMEKMESMESKEWKEMADQNQTQFSL